MVLALDRLPSVSILPSNQGSIYDPWLRRGARDVRWNMIDCVVMGLTNDLPPKRRVGCRRNTQTEDPVHQTHGRERGVAVVTLNDSALSRQANW